MLINMKYSVKQEVPLITVLLAAELLRCVLIN